VLIGIARPISRCGEGSEHAKWDYRPNPADETTGPTALEGELQMLGGRALKKKIFTTTTQREIWEIKRQKKKI